MLIVRSIAVIEKLTYARKTEKKRYVNGMTIGIAFFGCWKISVSVKYMTVSNIDNLRAIPQQAFYRRKPEKIRKIFICVLLANL